MTDELVAKPGERCWSGTAITADGRGTRCYVQENGVRSPSGLDRGHEALIKPQARQAAGKRLRGSPHQTGFNWACSRLTGDVARLTGFSEN